MAAGCLSGAMLMTVAFATAGASGASGTAPRAVPHNGIPAAGAKYHALLIRPQHIPVSTKITKPIPRGKTIDFVVCGVPQCRDPREPAEAGGSRPRMEGRPDPGWSHASHDR